MNNPDGRAPATMAMFAAAVLVCGIFLAFYFLMSPGREVAPNLPTAEAVAPEAQVTPNLRGDTSKLQQPAPPDATGSGPNAPQTP